MDGFQFMMACQAIANALPFAEGQTNYYADARDAIKLAVKSASWKAVEKQYYAPLYSLGNQPLGGDQFAPVQMFYYALRHELVMMVGDTVHGTGDLNSLEMKKVLMPNALLPSGGTGTGTDEAGNEGSLLHKTYVGPAIDLWNKAVTLNLLDFGVKATTPQELGYKTGKMSTHSEAFPDAQSKEALAHKQGKTPKLTDSPGGKQPSAKGSSSDNSTMILLAIGLLMFAGKL
jgi:hypothetical protein